MKNLTNENQQQLNIIISQLAWLQIRRLSRMLIPEKITVSQFQTLLAIKQSHTNCTLSHLACQTKLTNSTITDIINRLEHKQLIKRHQSPADMRITSISLTKTGIESLNRITIQNQETIAKDINHLSQQEKNQLQTYLETYLSILKIEV